WVGSFRITALRPCLSNHSLRSRTCVVLPVPSMPSTLIKKPFPVIQRPLLPKNIKPCLKTYFQIYENIYHQIQLTIMHMPASIPLKALGALTAILILSLDFTQASPN